FAADQSRAGARGPRRERRALEGPRRWLGTDRRDESISLPVHRLDDARLPRVVSEGVAQLANAARQYPIGDRGVGPYRVQQLALRDQTLRIGREVGEHGQ